MIPEIGTLSLVMALLFAVCLVFSKRLTTYYAIVETLAVVMAYGLLTVSFLNDDFTARYVFMNSSVSLPWYYKLAAVWGGHEGSMLLWVLILMGWMMAIVVLSRNHLERVLYQGVLKVLGLLSIGFILFLLCTSNPFLRQFSMQQVIGRDLNPLLQDPGFLFHPPMLYLGYVGFSVAFAFALVSLWLGRLESAWATWTRPWTLAAWSFLTAGITLGSWWAYRELGWGGWWFWDPVENASFMPWLVGTALLHSLVANEKRQLLKAWTVLLAIGTFSLSLIGTFLVRSGILTSVHAFAVDPARGLYILIFLMIVIGGSLLLFALRAETLKQEDKFFMISREGGLLLNNVFLSVAMLTVLLGTIYPLLIDALRLGKLSVGAPYFNAVFVPLMLPVLALMGVSLHAYYQQDSWKRLRASLQYPLLLSMISPILIGIWLHQPIQPLVFLGLGLGVWVIVATVKSLLTRLKNQSIYQISSRFWAVFFAHIGVAIVVLGISLTSGWSVEEDVKLSRHETIHWAGYQVVLTDIFLMKGPNYETQKVCFALSGATTICPEKRYYPVSHTMMSDAGIQAGFFKDIYIALGEPLGNDSWSVRLMYKPGVRWIWVGGFIIFLGGICALWGALLGKKNEATE